VIICGKPGVELTDYERHVLEFFRRYLKDPKKFNRCPWCFHKLKNCGKCKLCMCDRNQRSAPARPRE
jgi:hypothetical protein